MQGPGSIVSHVLGGHGGPHALSPRSEPRDAGGDRKADRLAERIAAAEGPKGARVPRGSFVDIQV